jgi:hypothetical protein
MNLADTPFVRNLTRCGDPLGEADVVAFERELGVRLPAEYRDFLLLRNGGRFEPFLAFPLPTEEYSDYFGLWNVYGLLRASTDPTTDLRVTLEVHEGRIPRHTLPIADDGDNELLLDLGVERNGALFLWIRDDEMVKDVEDNRIPAAGSFLEMASRCFVLEG